MGSNSSTRPRGVEGGLLANKGSGWFGGVDPFAGYLQHDNKEETLRVYGEHVIPAMKGNKAARV